MPFYLWKYVWRYYDLADPLPFENIQNIFCETFIKCKGKGKAVPLQARGAQKVPGS